MNYEQTIDKYAEFMKQNPEYSDSLLKDLVNIQAKRGNLELLKELHKIGGFTFDEYTMINAVKAKTRGSLVIKWLIEINCPRDEYVFTEAAYKGDLEIMEILLKHKFPWNAYTFVAAIRNGNLRNMKWLYASGCPWDGEAQHQFRISKYPKENEEWVLKTLIPKEHSNLKTEISNENTSKTS